MPARSMIELLKVRDSSELTMKTHNHLVSEHFDKFRKSALAALALLERQRNTVVGRIFVRARPIERATRLHQQAEVALSKGDENDAVARWGGCVAQSVEILSKGRKRFLGRLFLSKRKLTEAKKIDAAFKTEVAKWKKAQDTLKNKLNSKKTASRSLLPCRDPSRGDVRVVVLVECLTERMALNGSAWPSIVFLHPDHFTPERGDMIYWPVGKFSLRVCELHAVVLAATLKAYDFVLLAHGVQPVDDNLRIGALRDALFVSAAHWSGYRGSGKVATGLTGRVVRSFLPRPVEFDEMLTLEQAFGSRVTVIAQDVSLGATRKPLFEHPKLALRLLPVTVGGVRDDRRTVFILPAVFAVGGVERNTIEVIRKLQSEFRFVIITNESHNGNQGVSHQQLDGIADAVYDLAEIGEPGRYLDLLDALRRAYNPALLYICNGSSWLAENAMRLKKIFADIPIVDQQVYDTVEGWIACYEDPLKRPYDHFIATNQKIKDAFEQRYHIAPKDVSLIYSCIDPELIAKKASKPTARAQELKKVLGLQEGSKCFGFVGRLVEQKKPIAFLELALRAKQAGLSDHFVLVGSGVLKGKCEEFVEANKLENVRMLDHCDRTSDLYEILDGLIVSSAYEGLPIVSIEAMAAGLPVLATDVGDIALTFRRHKTGSIFTHPGDLDAMYADFKRWRDDGAVQSENALSAVDGVRTFFSSVAAAERYRACWSALIDASLTKADKAVQRISVVIPTYNRAAQLEKTVYRCVECADGVELEFLIVDDGSKDDTAERLESMTAKVRNLKYIRVQNGGPGRARNIGAASASHPVVLFLGDDILPRNPDFFKVHAQLHAANPSPLFGVLGKVEWPSDLQFPVNFVMAHIQGAGGEQFGYRQIRAFTEVEWKFFYTSNVSVKREVVADWLTDGFSSSFPMAAFEDCELAYRLSKRGFKLYYDPTSEGEHAHLYSAKTFLGRQMTCGMMSVLFLRLHPEVAAELGLFDLRRALESKSASGDISELSHYLSVVEGVKSLACLLERQPDWGAYAWHADFLSAVFELAYLQGHVAGETDPEQNQVAAYQAILKAFWTRMAKSFHQEAAFEVFHKFAEV